MHQCTYFCLMAGVNAVHSQAQVKNKISMLQLKFCQVPPTPVGALIFVRRAQSMNHTLVSQKTIEGSWNLDTRHCKKVTSNYVHLRCHECQKSAGCIALVTSWHTCVLVAMFCIVKRSNNWFYLSIVWYSSFCPKNGFKVLYLMLAHHVEERDFCMVSL